MADQVLGNLVWRITGDNRAFDTAVEKSQKKVFNFGKTASSVGKGLTLGVTTPLIGLGTIAVATAAKIETQRVAFGKLLQDTEKGAKLFEELKRFSAETPLQLEDITKGAQRLLAFGVAADDVQDKLRRLGDAALGNGDTLDRLTNAYGKLLAKGKATLEEINLFTEAGVPLLDELAKGWGVTTQEVLKFIEKGKVGFEDVDDALKRLTDEGGQFSGVMAAIAETTEGKLSTAIDNVKLAGAEFGALLLPVVKDVLDGIIDLAKFFQNLDDGTKSLIVDIAKFAAVIGPTILVIGKLSAAVTAFNATALFGPTGIIIGVGLAVVAISKLVKGYKEAQTEFKKFQELKATEQLVAIDNLSNELLDLAKDLQFVNQTQTQFVNLQRDAAAERLRNNTAIRDTAKLLGIEIDTSKVTINTIGNLLQALQNKRDELTGVNKTTTQSKKVTKEYVDTLTEWEEKLRDLGFAQREAAADEAEAAGKFKEASALRLALLNEQEKKEIDLVNASTQAESRKERDITAIQKIFAKEREKITEEEAENRKQSAISTAQFIASQTFQIISNLASAVGQLRAVETEQRIAQIDEQLQKELEAKGLLEETERQRLERELQLAIDSGNTKLEEDRRTELERLNITENAERQKALVRYEGELAGWKAELANAIVGAAQAQLAALSSGLQSAPFPFNLVITGALQTFAGIASGLQIAAVKKSKPKKPAFRDGVENVASDMSATVHQGEMIIPRNFADSVRRGDISINRDTAQSAGNSSGGVSTLRVIFERADRTWRKIYEATKNGELKISDAAIVAGD